MSNSPNSFGNLFRITSFGESHGAGIGVVVEGCPAGVLWKDEVMTDFTLRRKPGGVLVSERKEDDEVEFLSGIFEGQTLGTPIAMIVRNQDHRSKDYDAIKNNPRAGHADDMWKNKFGHSDHRGGGRSSGRETLARVMGGAVAKNFVKQLYPKLSIESQALRVGPLSNEGDKDFAKKLEALLLEAKANGQSYGGLAEIKIKFAPDSLGEPVFLKLKSELANAMMTVGAVVGVELGAGFEAAASAGTEFHSMAENYGGIRGGMSTGEPIVLRVGIKPSSSILDVAKKGRHDPCILLRALVVFEAMAWLVLADQILYRRLNSIADFNC